MIIWAHRGASNDSPENTMASFNAAMEQQCDGIELDVRLTKDGIPVVIHDATVNRTSNQKGYIHEFTLKELREYDFGSWFSNDFKYERIPTLQEVLELLQNKDVMLNIELKNGPVIPDGLEKNVLELIDQYEMNDRVIISSFDHISLMRVRDLDSKIKIGVILHLNLINLFEYIKHSGVNPYSIHPNFYYVTDEMVKEAHVNGIKVFPYTINDVSTLKKYQRIGIDGVITNNPQELKESRLFSP
jgi:glycerophosphoryl diester phosphodiesterase